MAEPVTSYLAAAQALAGARSAVVVGHVDPDGDAIGSSLALALVLRRLGIDAVPVLPDEERAPETYSFLPGFQLLRRPSEVEPAQVFVALDTPNRARLGATEALCEASERRLVIDHHPDNVSFGDVNLIDPSAAAVGQMVWRLMPLLDVPPDYDTALCLYVALLTDTGRFQYSNADSTVLRDAAAMIDQGIDVHEIYERIYENQSLAHLEIVGRVKSRVRLANNGRVAYSWVTDSDFAETGAIHEATENLVDAIRVIGGVDVVFLAKLAGKTCRVSLRAKRHNDVGGVARHFGGGGHVAAAGFASTCSLEEILPDLLSLLPGAGEE